VFRGGFQRCPNDGARLASGGDDPLVGTILAERYQIDAVIGDGGIGRVYRARHVRMSRQFAIKVPFGELGYDRKARARFANEAEAASRLSHPNVIGVVDVGETSEGLFYMAMDLAEGENLGDALAGGPLPEARVLAILAQLSDGLAHAHERGLVHRDLKPDNVTLTAGPDGAEQIRIVDFGLAIVDAEATRDRLTTEGVVLGTPHYMAPEQATDEALDFRTDLFAVGLIAYELLAGVHPFDGAPVDVARQNLSRELPPIVERAGVHVDPLLEALVRWLTEKEPSRRPPQTALVGRVARALLGGDRATARAILPAALIVGDEAGAIVEVTQDVPAMTPPPRGASAPRPPSHAEPPPSQAEPLLDDPLEIPGGASGRRRLVIVALLVVALVVAGLALVLSGGGGGDAPALIPDAATVAMLEADAAVVIEPEVADAAVVLDLPVDAGVPVDAGRRAPPPRIDAGTRVVRRPDAGVARPAPVDAAVATLSSNATLRQLYEQVGRQLDQAIKARGNDATEPYRKRYAGIPPYLEAVRKDDLRAQAEKQLRALARDLAALK
jgi:serine/threonine-protein kinase